MSTPTKSISKEALKLVRDRIKSEKDDDSKKDFDIKRAAELMALGRKETK